MLIVELELLYYKRIKDLDNEIGIDVILNLSNDEIIAIVGF